MRSFRQAWFHGGAVALVLAGLLTGCRAGGEPAGDASEPTASPGVRSPTSTAAPPTPPPTPPHTSASRPIRPPGRTETVDPRWRFYVRDRSRHGSPWFAGRHRLMIGYGCTRAPYYAPDPRCPGTQGFHHGIDVAMPCGTPLYAGRGGRVLGADAPGAPGPAYGPYAFRVRVGGRDVLIGHVRKVYVVAGDVVRRGALLARAGDEGAPDGCHLHFEVRRAGGGLEAAVDPAPYLRLR